MGGKILTVSAEKILSDRRVQVALKRYAGIQSDFDDFDGDRRGISAHLWDAKVKIVELVSKALRTGSPCKSNPRQGSSIKSLADVTRNPFISTSLPNCPNCHRCPDIRHTFGRDVTETFEITCQFQSLHCTFRPLTLDRTEEGARSRWFEAVNGRLVKRLLKRTGR